MEIDYGALRISLDSEYLGFAYPWDGKYRKSHFMVHCHFTNFGEPGDFSFDYYANGNKTEMDDYDLGNSLWCCLTDAYSIVNNDLNRFRDEYGFDKMNELIEAWQECTKTFKKLKESGFPLSVNLINHLAEDYA